MKKQITLLGFLLILVSALVFTAFSQKEKNKQQQKEQKQNQGKNQDKPGKENNKGDKNESPGLGKDQKDNRGNDKNDDRGMGNEKMGKGKNENRNGPGRSGDGRDVFVWNPETFKDRNKIRNQDKVTLCHKFNNGDEPAVTLRVSSHAVKAHMNHGDVMGECPAINDSRYSDIFLRNRNDYYNRIQDSEEQVVYSRSILDYALERLTNARSQLAIMRTNNMPAADIERRQVVVVELEQNVSLLETLIGVTANIIANKLQD